MYYMLFYYLVENYKERRTPFRELHLGYANKSVERGELVMAGALDAPADKALLVFKCNDKSVVEDFARNDPYVLNGIIEKWEVRPWTVVIGG